MPTDFEELKPYRSLLLVRVAAGTSPDATVDELLDQVQRLVDDTDGLQVVTRPDSADFGGMRAGFVHYLEERRAGWSDGSVVDHLNQLVVACGLDRLLAIYASASRFRRRLQRRIGDPDLAGLSALETIPRGVLNAAFVQGTARTLWLSGTHRRTTVKADSKILSGLDLRDSLDPLADQSYYFSATRSIPPALGAPVGVSPRKSAVWFGVSRSWEDFTGGVKEILGHLAATTDSIAGPLPILAVETAELADLAGAFDVSLQPPELDFDPDLDPDDRETLEKWAYRSSFELVDPGPPKIRTRVFLENRLLGTADLEVEASGPEHVKCSVDGEPQSAEMAEEHEEALRLLADRRCVKIRFESGHTLSDGSVFQQRHRDMPFSNFRFVDFAGFDVKKEKPTPVTDVGTQPGQHSLFEWTFQFWPNLDGTTVKPGGLLVSDDGSMEIADFIHLDQTEPVPILSLIHVKAAGSDSPNRQISVSSYEVVTGQAVKNLRSFDQLVLREGLAAGLGHVISQVAFRDRQPSTREAMIEALESLGTNYRRRLVIVQPHVLKARYDAARADDTSSDAARLRQLDTLLLGAEADARAVGADFVVVTAA